MKNLLNIFIFIVIAFFLVKACDRAVEVSSWPETKGEIISYDVQTYRDSETYTDSKGRKHTEWEDEYKIIFTYRFQVNGQVYRGDFTVDDLDNSAAVNRRLKTYPNGKKDRVKYDPNNPNDSEYRH